MDMTHKFGAVNSGELDPTSLRNTPRESMFLVGKLSFGDESTSLDVRIRNLSPSGMMVESPRLGTLGGRVFIEIKAYGKLPGHIAWIAEKRMGVALDTEIDPSLAKQAISAKPPVEGWQPSTLHKVQPRTKFQR